MTDVTVEEVRAELAAIQDPRMREVNARHGDDHGANLAALRRLAKRIGTRHDLAGELWRSGDSDARLVAILVCRPRELTADELDAMLRESRTPKVRDWLVSYVVKKGPHAEELRGRWLPDPDPDVAAAGWALTADSVTRHPDRVDLDDLLGTIETEMLEAPAPAQWEMNTCLAMIGIHHASHRDRAIGIGERLGVLKDYPTPPNCTSPFAPAWITEMVRRREG